MFIRQKIAVLFVLSLVLSLACRLTPTQTHTFENEFFSFTIPAGWQTIEEVRDQPATPGQEYKGLGVQELVTIQYPPEAGKGRAFFVVASSPLAEGENLESRFTMAYQTAVPEIKNPSEESFIQGELSGYEITYTRPWGEPWWQFRDIWLEKDGVIYVLSFYASHTSFETYAETFNEILESFRFKD